MGNGLKYTVPRFQRDYSWEEEQWRDLWLDACGLSEQGRPEPHYMGYLVFASSDDKNFVIIDGQQRLVTISILILAAMDFLKELNEPGTQDRLKALRGAFIGFQDISSLELQNKITLNRNNETYFRQYLCKLKKPPLRKTKASEKLMGKAFKYFKAQFEKEFNGGSRALTAEAGAAGAKTSAAEENPAISPDRQNFDSPSDSVRRGEAVARFVDRLADGLIFTTVAVGDEAAAYTVFETLNARGVHLSVPDLVKNYIFSLMSRRQDLHESALDDLEEKWSEITEQLGRQSFSDFIRAEWNARNSLVRKKELFKKIKNEINTEKKADCYLDHLGEGAEIYAALKDPRDEFWRTHQDGRYNKPDLISSLKTLNLFRITNSLSALTAAFRELEADKFTKILSYAEAVAVRCHITGNPGHQEAIYNKIAQIIVSPSKKDGLKKIRAVLREIYPPDESFISSFKNKRFKTAEKQIRGLLGKIENRLSPEFSTAPAGDAAGLTLEHVLPKNPDPEWRKAFVDEEAEDCCNLIGNMTLLSAKNNKSAARLGFDKKKEIFYGKSSLKITKQIAEKYDRWDRDSILSRGDWLGKQAAKIWQIPPD